MKKHSDSTHTTVHYKEQRTRNIILSVFISLAMTFSSLIGLVPDIVRAEPVHSLYLTGENGNILSKDGDTVYLIDPENNRLATVECSLRNTILDTVYDQREIRGELNSADDIIRISITPCPGFENEWFYIRVPPYFGNDPRVSCSGNTFIYEFSASQFGIEEYTSDCPINIVMDDQPHTFRGRFLDDTANKKHVIFAGSLVTLLCDANMDNGYADYSTDGGNTWTILTDRVTTLDDVDVYVRYHYDNQTQMAMCGADQIFFRDDDELNETGWDNFKTLMLWLEPLPTEITTVFITPDPNGTIPDGISASFTGEGVSGVIDTSKNSETRINANTVEVTLNIPEGGQYYVLVWSSRGGALDNYDPQLWFGDWYFPGETEFTVHLLNYGYYTFEVWRADQFAVDWTYDSTKPLDEQIIGGRVDFESAVLPDGSDGYGGAQGNPNDSIVSHRILPGSLVTIRLMPDHGYQFVEGYLMGYIPVTPSEDLGTFTFEMPASPVHLSSLFIEFNDEIISNVEGIDGGILLSGQNATDIGNVRLNVTDADITASEQAAIDSAAGDMYVLNTVDLSLESFVKKGSWTDEWTNSIIETEGDIMIVLNVGTGLDPDAEYDVIREHEGVYTTIPASYDAENGLLTFSSNQFSTYAIVSSSPRSGNSDSGSGSGSSAGSSGSGGDSLTVDGFIGRLYVNMLGRSGDASGMDYWKNKIYTEGMTGADLVNGFIGSQEFTNLGLDDTEFVKILYKTMFGREGDTDGINTWVTMLSAGASRQEIVNNFINSTEWANLCLRYGIRSGGTGIPNITVVPNVGTNNFVNRLYTLCLGRSADQGGFTYWTNSLANMRISGTDCAFGFVFSDEVSDANLSDEEFIKLLYSVLLGRDAGESEIANWMNQLQNGKTREEIFYGFAGSSEFGRICAENGIVR